MPVRKDELVTGETYHVYNKSIAGYKIFVNDSDYQRVLLAIKNYQIKDPKTKTADLVKLKHKAKTKKLEICNSSKIVDIVAYCIMPTHMHLILKQNVDGGIENFMKQISHSYAKYFNLKYNRKGPLWEGRYKNILIGRDEYLIHLTRYLHLNPASAFLVSKPEEWKYSSYNEYLGNQRDNICNFQKLMNIGVVEYKKFVQDNISYQRELSKIKQLIYE